MFIHAIIRKFVAYILLGAVSVKGECKWTPDKNGRVNLFWIITEIPKDAFHGCKELKSIWIADSVTRINYMAFRSSGLQEVIWEEPDYYDKRVEEGTELIFGAAVFYNCKSLKHISIPAKVLHLGSSVLAESGIESIDFAPAISSPVLRKIPANFVQGAPINSITIPSYITEIGPNAFRQSKLQSINFDSGSKLLEIKKTAFYETPLETGNFPNGASIANDAFQGVTTTCEHLFQAGNTVVNCQISLPLRKKGTKKQRKQRDYYYY